MKQIFLQVLIFISVTMCINGQLPANLTSDDADFFPEDIVIVNNVAYVSGLGDGTLKSFNLNLANPIGESFADAEVGYTQRWGLKSDGTVLLSILDNADFGGGMSGPAKLVEYDIASATKTGEWDLPAGSIGHTVSIVDGKYYVTDFGQPRIFEIDPATSTVNDSWFTSTDWDPTISGIGGTIYNNNGGFYISQGNKLWYLPISGGTPGTLQEVIVDGLDIIDADGISWDDTKNILYFATNDTGDPENAGTASRVVFSDATTATGSVIASDFDDSSGLWFYRDGGKEYIFVLESQFGGLFGINSYESPFNIQIIELASSSDNTVSVYNSFEDATLTGGQQAFYGAAGPVGISGDVEFPQFINFYDIDLTDFGLTMTLFNNSDAADLVLPDGRFDRYYFAYDGDISNISISGGSPGLTDNATVSALPAGYEIPLSDLFGTGYPLPIALPDGGFVIELGGGTDLTELGQTLTVDFGLQGVSVYNSFEDATLTGGQQAFYGAAGPVAVSDAIEFPQFINFYDIDINDCGLTMTLFNNSDAADLLLPDGRFDRYYFAYDGDISNISISGGSPGLADNATVSVLPAGYEIPLSDLFGTGYPLPITLPDGGFVVELGGGTDLTELGQTLSVDFGCDPPESLVIDGETFFPEDIVIANDVAYVSGLGDGTLRSFDLTQTNPTAQLFAAAEVGYTQRWGVKSDGTVLLSILDNADFGGGMSGPAKLVEYDIVSATKTGEWDLPVGSIGHTVSIVDGKYYVTDFGQPRIFEIDPTAGTVNDNWFTSAEWDPTISGIGGTIYDNEGGFYVSQGNKLWYLPINGGTPGTLQEVNVSGLTTIDADGISWDDANNTLYYATNDTGDPANVGTVYRLVFSNATTATGSVIATGFNDSSGLWYYEDDGREFLYVLESQFGALFGINTFEPPFNITILELSQGTPENLTTDDLDFFPEDIVIANNVAYVSGLGDGTLKAFNLNLENPTGETFAEAEANYTQRWGVKSDGTILLSLLNNADFGGGMSGPAKLVEYDIATATKTGEWDLPAGSIGHTVSIVDGKYYVTDFGQPRIFEIDPTAGTVNDNWFTSTEWDPTISGIGGTIYDNEGGFYVSQGNRLWYLPISGGTPGTLQEVNVSGLTTIDADGISWDDANNTLYYATNDTGDPANVGTVYSLIFSDAITAQGNVVASGFDDSSGLWYYENNSNRYVYVLESQFGALFGINEFDPPFNIEIIELDGPVSSGVDLNLSLEADNQLYEQYTNVSYTFLVTNEGDQTATNIVVDVTLPEGLVYTDHSTTDSEFSLYFEEWKIPMLEPGATAVLDLTLFSLIEDQDITYFTQIVAADQPDVDSTPDNDTDQTPDEDDEASVTIMDNSDGGYGGGDGTADLELDVSVDGTFDNYEHIFFTITLTNNGPDPATGIVISTPEPEGNGKFASSGPENISDGDWSEWAEEWTIDELASGETATLVLDIFSLGEEDPITLFSQVFIVNELDPDSSPANNTSGIPSEDDEASATIQFAESFNNTIEQSALNDQSNLGSIENGSANLNLTNNVLAKTTKVQLAPNPFRGLTNFEIQLMEEGLFHFQVFDITGTLVSSQKMNLDKGTNRFDYDGSQLANGYYSFRFSNQNGFVTGKMIVIE